MRNASEWAPCGVGPVHLGLRKQCIDVSALWELLPFQICDPSRTVRSGGITATPENSFESLGQKISRLQILNYASGGIRNELSNF